MSVLVVTTMNPDDNLTMVVRFWKVTYLDVSISTADGHFAMTWLWPVINTLSGAVQSP